MGFWSFLTRERKHFKLVEKLSSTQPERVHSGINKTLQSRFLRLKHAELAEKRRRARNKLPKRLLETSEKRIKEIKRAARRIPA